MCVCVCVCVGGGGGGGSLGTGMCVSSLSFRVPRLPTSKQPVASIHKLLVTFHFIHPTTETPHNARVTRRVGPFLVFGHFVFEPFHHVVHLGVDSKLAWGGAAVAPAGHALQVIPAAFLARHGSP